MSGRPVNPSYTTRTFAPNANYGAGPNVWNGQATKVEPAGAASVGFEPGTFVTAEEYNRLFYDGFTQQANAKTVQLAWAEYTGQMPALNLRPAAVENFNCAVWNAAERRWYFGKDSAVIKFSCDLGHTVSSDVLSAVSGTDHIRAMAVDSSGNMIAVTDVGYYEYAKGTATWTLRTGGFAADTIGTSQRRVLAYDSSHGKWLAGGATASGFFKLYYSSDRINWTACSPSAATVLGGSGTTALFGRLATNNSGTAVAGYIADGQPSTLRTAVSTDGGATYTANATISVGFNPTHVALTYEPDADLFVLIASSTSGAGSTKVWTSEDGVTWTLVCTLAAAALSNVQCLGELWVALNEETGELVESTDRGVTWTGTGFAQAAQVVFENLHVGNGQFMYLDSLQVYSGLRAGRPGTAIT